MMTHNGVNKLIGKLSATNFKATLAFGHETPMQIIRSALKITEIDAQYEQYCDMNRYLPHQSSYTLANRQCTQAPISFDMVKQKFPFRFNIFPSYPSKLQTLFLYAIMLDMNIGEIRINNITLQDAVFNDTKNIEFLDIGPFKFNLRLLLRI